MKSEENISKNDYPLEMVNAERTWKLGSNLESRINN
jgi:hypothetical protein